MKESDFIKFKNESYRLKLKQAANDPTIYNRYFLYFGGTGAVGGQAVIETIQSYEYMLSLVPNTSGSAPVLVVTGRFPQEVDTFMTKLRRVFDDKRGRPAFEKADKDDQEAYLVLEKKSSGIRVEFFLLNAAPEFRTDLKKLTAKAKSEKQIVESLKKEASKITSPFEQFVKDYIEKRKLPKSFRFRAVTSGIPIPSVATYHFDKVDQILIAQGIAQKDHDKSIERSIKIEIVKGLAQDFGDIKQHLAEEVLMAHTTAVGGMYRIVDGKPVIKLGYAHSSLGDLLMEKQYYAQQLTMAYSKLNLKILITASAIGIDFIYDTGNLPMAGTVRWRFLAAKEAGNLPFPERLLYGGTKKADEGKLFNRIFSAHPLSAFHPMLDEKGKPKAKAKMKFVGSDKENPPLMKIRYALRSGENGLFSLDNAWALYLNMKIATQEELAHVLVYGAMFGDDAQKPWFDKDGIHYYTQTDNSMLVFSLLGNRADFREYQLSGFTAKAFQDLGSSKHQGELHTIGMYMLLHRLNSMDSELISRQITNKYNDEEAMEFMDRNTRPLLIEQIIQYDPVETARRFARLLTLRDAQDLADLMNYHGDISRGFVKIFFQRLLDIVRQTIHTITSLGTPIIYQDNKGNDRILVGPYFAPADLIITHNTTLIDFIARESAAYGLDQGDFYEWLITNNGFVDLRPSATIVTAKSHKLGLFGRVKKYEQFEKFRQAVKEIPTDEYFTTSGILAFVGRMKGLYERLSTFDVSLGTFNGWKAIFPVDHNMSHPVVPGIVEAMRMYTEGLGKVTGTELLYPGHGYFE